MTEPHGLEPKRLTAKLISWSAKIEKDQAIIGIGSGRWVTRYLGYKNLQLGLPKAKSIRSWRRLRQTHIFDQETQINKITGVETILEVGYAKNLQGDLFCQ